MISSGYQFVYYRAQNDKINLSLVITVYQIFSLYFTLKDFHSMIHKLYIHFLYICFCNKLGNQKSNQGQIAVIQSIRL